MRQEHIDRRIIGAVRLVDANTGLQVPGPLSLDAEGVRFLRTRRDLYVICRAPGFREYTRAFDAPPALPPLQSVDLTLNVSDPTGRYFPRQSTLSVPRDPDPANANTEQSVFRPMDVALFPTPTLRTMPGWAVIRATVVSAGDKPAPLPGALIRVLRVSDGTLLARSLTEWRGRTVGESMVPVSGLPVTTWGTDDDFGDNSPVLLQEIQATLDVVYDPAFDPSGEAIPDPDDVESRRDDLATAQFTVALASGRSLVTTLPIPLPAAGDGD